MKLSVKLAAWVLGSLSITACNSGGSLSLPGTANTSVTQWRSRVSAPEWELKGLAKPACPQITGHPRCLVLLESKSNLRADVAGWKPIDFQRRYHLPITEGSGSIVAIIDPGDNPNVANDLAVYRKQFKLGPAKFKKFNQEGQQGNYPPYTGSSIEIDLDVEMVSAACPKCTTYLVEANANTGSDLGAAESEAVTLGAHIISNSFICYNALCGLLQSYFDTPGVMYVASAGDAGYNNSGPPMAYPTVVAVGGTVLSKSGKAYKESVWDGTGSGCSSNGGLMKPSWQHDPGCAGRTATDISAVAWQVAVYDSFESAGYQGWFSTGGTSVSAPLVAGIYGLAGNASKQNAGQRLWTLTKRQRSLWLNEITSGNNGLCGGSYLCTAGTGQFKTYSGPAGWGTPHGVKAF